MEVSSSSVQKLCQQLLYFAIQRCRLSEDLCRLSVVIKSSVVSDRPLVHISISDTGVGSRLDEFQDLKCAHDSWSLRVWDGMLSITTTGVSDTEIYHYNLAVPSRKLIRLPSTLKRNAKFSGTEVSLTSLEDIDTLVSKITGFLQKMLILKIHNIAVELATEVIDYGLQHENILLTIVSEDSLSTAVSSNELLKLGLEEYVYKHGKHSSGRCQHCFSSSECLKVSNATAQADNHITGAVNVDTVIIISTVSEQMTAACFRTDNKTEICCYRDFSPASIDQSVVSALKSIKWNSYGLTLKNIVGHDGYALVEWEKLPPNTHINIALHCHNEQVSILPHRQRLQLEKKLIKKSVTLALDDMKEKYAGVLLCPHALKICTYAPDLARSISGLILTSDDYNFQGECFSLLGLNSDAIKADIVENCIEKKLISAIEMNHRKPIRSQEAAPTLFDIDCPHESDCHFDDYEDDEEGFYFMEC